MPRTLKDSRTNDRRFSVALQSVHRLNSREHEARSFQYHGSEEAIRFGRERAHVIRAKQRIMDEWAERR